MKTSGNKIILSCEHGGCSVPSDYRHLFTRSTRILKSHRGWDRGALVLAVDLAKTINASLFYSETSRLLVDLNRSLHHPHLFSEYSKHCDEKIREVILQKYYFPYRKKIESSIKKNTGNGKPVIHFSIHSFTPELDGKKRNADIGLLYDPDRKNERRICLALQSILHQIEPELTVRRNFPYRGNADGLTTGLRKKFARTTYAGIEIEINQKHVTDNTVRWSWLRKSIIESVTTCIKKH